MTPSPCDFASTPGPAELLACSSPPARDLCGSHLQPASRRPSPPVGGRMAATLESLALLRAVRQLDAEGGLSDMELEEVRASLKGGREVLANLLAYPPRKAEDRAAVRGMTVEVRGGQSVRLGALDVDNALILRCVSRSTRSRGRRVARRSSRDAASRARAVPPRADPPVPLAAPPCRPFSNRRGRGRPTPTPTRDRPRDPPAGRAARPLARALLPALSAPASPRPAP